MTFNVFFQSSESKGSSLSLLRYLDPIEKQKRDTARSKSKTTDEHTVQLTEVEAFFIMKGKSNHSKYHIHLQSVAVRNLPIVFN